MLTHRLLACLCVAFAPGCGGPGRDAGGSDAAQITDSGDAGDATPATDSNVPPIPCVDQAIPGDPFGAPVVISDPTRFAEVPALAARGTRLLIAWQQVGDDMALHVVFVLAEDGCIGAVTEVPETFIPARRPSVAATDTGWVIAYEATDLAAQVARFVTVAPDGSIITPPETLSAPGATAARVDVAAYGDDLAFAWTDSSEHSFALRGSSETVGPMPIGTNIQFLGLVNYPRIALASDGTVHVAYRDGGATASEVDVFLITRPPGGPFGAPVNVSNSAGLLSDFQDLFVEPDGALYLVWADQDPVNVLDFETSYAVRSAAGVLSSPALFGAQGSEVWDPRVGAGLNAVWYVGAIAGGELFWSDGPVPGVPILAGIPGRAPDLMLDDAGGRHLVFVEPTTPARVSYAFGPAP